jgi:hypothetical protein
LTNCEEWRKKVTGIPAGYTAKCGPAEDPFRPGGGTSILNDVIGLFLIRSPAGDKKGLSGAVIAGIVIAVIAFLAGIGVGALFFLRRGQTDARAYTIQSYSAIKIGDHMDNDSVSQILPTVHYDISTLDFHCVHASDIKIHAGCSMT